MNANLSIAGRLRHLIDRIADIGISASLPAVDRKHVRFCNLASFSVALVSAAFFFAEAPLIIDFDRVVPLDWAILVLRPLFVLPFLLPLRLNRLGRHAAARLVFSVWATCACFIQTVLYTQAAPTHMLLLPVVAASLALFPRAERRRMWTMVATGALTFLLCSWWRSSFEPLVPVMQAWLRIATEVSVGTGALVLVVIVCSTQRSTTNEAEDRFAAERERAEGLLLNILPESIALRLKESPGSIADAFDEVTVMFADLVGFTPLAQQLQPAQLVDLMDRVFSEFDHLTERHGLEKIKTIGDAYMVAGGLPVPSDDHPAAVAEMALEMLPIIDAIESPLGQPLNLRIGIAHGAAVAGVIGKKKFIYDLWGDTVNTASRLESHGTPGRIQVDEAFRARLEDRYVFESRGEIEIKGKGALATWYLVGRRSA